MADEIEIRKMKPSDAVGLTDCIRRSYGDAYPKRTMYDPIGLAEQVKSQGYSGVVAVSGVSIVGHIGYSRPNPAASVVEAGTTVVDASHRGTGLMGRLAAVLGESIVADGADGFVHFPTTAHPVMQKASLRSGGCETGLLLGYLPAEARDLTIGGSGEDRLAVTVVYQPLIQTTMRTIFTPDCYHDLIAGFATQLRLDRILERSTVDPSGKTSISAYTDLHRKLERLTVKRIGHDFAETVRSASSNINAMIVHVDLPMDQPELHYAVEALRAAGFVFAAWLPGWNESDALRLQWLRNPQANELRPTLHSTPANDLAALIRSELNLYLH